MKPETLQQLMDNQDKGIMITASVLLIGAFLLFMVWLIKPKKKEYLFDCPECGFEGSFENEIYTCPKCNTDYNLTNKNK